MATPCASLPAVTGSADATVRKVVDGARLLTGSAAAHHRLLPLANCEGAPRVGVAYRGAHYVTLSVAGVTMPFDPPTLHENLTIIEFADPLTLDQLIADSSAKAPLLVRLSDTVAAVEPKHCDAVVERLRKLGHLPKVVD